MASQFTEDRLDSLRSSEDWGGGSTERARTIRELIDEIRALRQQVAGLLGED